MGGFRNYGSLFWSYVILRHLIFRSTTLGPYTNLSTTHIQVMRRSFEAQGPAFRVPVLEFRVQGLGCRVQGLGVRGRNQNDGSEGIPHNLGVPYFVEQV